MWNSITTKEMISPHFIIGVLVVIALGLALLFFEAPVWSIVLIVIVLSVVVGIFAPD